MNVDPQPATEQTEAMDVDAAPSAGSKKRSADDEEQPEAGAKKARFEEKTPNLKRYAGL